MTDPIQAAMREAEEATTRLIEAADNEDACDLEVAEAETELRAAIARLAATCIEEAAKAAGNVLHPYSAEGSEAMDAIRALLPEKKP